MNKYPLKKFSFPTIPGISEKALTIHLGLYAGYVNSLNAHYEKLSALQKDSPDDMLTISALTRRIGFELAGVYNHERYFEVLVGGAMPCESSCALHSLIEKQFNSFTAFTDAIQRTAISMRGIGWVLVTYDKTQDALHIIWVSDHELGNVNLPVLVAVDMWEHAYMVDFIPSEKGNYVTAYLAAMNWHTVSDRFDSMQ